MNLSVKDAARLLSVTEKTIYRWIKRDVLPSYKVHGSYRFNRAELLDWATSRRMGVSVEAYSEPEDDAQTLPTLGEALGTGGIFYRIEGKTRDEAIADAVQHLRLPEEVNRQHLLQMLIGREKLASTAIGEGIAIPHPRSPGLLNVIRPTLTLCFLEHPVDFQALDGQPVSILLLIISPHLRAHLHLLARLGFVLHDPEFREALHAEGSREKICAALAQAEAKIKATATSC
jgi:PTS system nitrogen regulatory IIA component